MVPRNGAARPAHLDVTDAMEERAAARSVSLTVVPAGGAAGTGRAALSEDPFAEVQV
jgi:hypothetical protein